MNSTMNQTIGASASPLAAVCFSTISTLRQSSSWWNPWSILTRIPWGSDVAVCKENPERVLVLLKAHSTNVFSCCWRKVAADCSALSDFRCWIRSLHLRSSCKKTCGYLLAGHLLNQMFHKAQFHKLLKSQKCQEDARITARTRKQPLFITQSGDGTQHLTLTVCEMMGMDKQHISSITV